jgi:hypothetical protein
MSQSVNADRCPPEDDAADSAEASRLAIPTEQDWRSEPWGLDEEYAYNQFHGKDLQEAFQLFVENSLARQEDILFMPLRCFRFYVHAYIDYLLSPESRGDCDGANCFFILPKLRMDDIRASTDLLQRRLERVLRRLREGQDWYDADRGIYEDFAEQANEFLAALCRPK